MVKFLTDPKGLDPSETKAVQAHTATMSAIARAMIINYRSPEAAKAFMKEFEARFGDPMTKITRGKAGAEFTETLIRGKKGVLPTEHGAPVLMPGGFGPKTEAPSLGGHAGLTISSAERAQQTQLQQQAEAMQQFREMMELHISTVELLKKRIVDMEKEEAIRRRGEGPLKVEITNSVPIGLL